MVVAPLVSLCVHGHAASAFLARHQDALLPLLSRGKAELLIYADANPSSLPARIFKADGLAYNHALQALMRQAQGEWLLLADASDTVYFDDLFAAAMRARKEIAVVMGNAPGTTEWKRHFLTHLSPGIMLMRRAAAMRAVRATEYGLMGQWETLAQLAKHGAVHARPAPLGQKIRARDASFWLYDVREGFFQPDRPERFCPWRALYDMVTLERAMADSEHFIVRWPSFAALPVEMRTRLMQQRRAFLYAAAMRQAADDHQATLALHFAARALVASVPEAPAAKAGGWRGLWDKCTGQANVEMVPAITRQEAHAMLVRFADKALAEQQKVLREILGDFTAGAAMPEAGLRAAITRPVQRLCDARG